IDLSADERQEGLGVPSTVGAVTEVPVQRSQSPAGRHEGPPYAPGERGRMRQRLAQVVPNPATCTGGRQRPQLVALSLADRRLVALCESLIDGPGLKKHQTAAVQPP